MTKEERLEKARIRLWEAKHHDKPEGWMPLDDYDYLGRHKSNPKHSDFKISERVIIYILLGVGIIGFRLLYELIKYLAR